MSDSRRHLYRPDRQQLTAETRIVLRPPKGSSRIVIILNAGGQWPPYAFFLNVDYDALHFHKYSFGIEGSQKSTLCTLLIMLTIMDDP